MPEHAGTGIAHNLSDLCLGLRLVAVDPAAAAGGLILLKGAGGKPFAGVGDQVPAFFARLVCAAVTGAAVDGHHGGKGLMFILYSRAAGWHIYLRPSACMMSRQTLS